MRRTRRALATVAVAIGSCLGMTTVLQVTSVDPVGAVDLGGDYVGTYGGYRTYCVNWSSWTRCTGYQTRYLTIPSGTQKGCLRLYRRNVTFTVGGAITNAGLWSSTNTIVCS